MQTKYNQLNVDKIYRPYSKKRDVIENIRFNTKGPVDCRLKNEEKKGESFNPKNKPPFKVRGCLLAGR